jgi:hypothetical protein
LGAGTIAGDAVCIDIGLQIVGCGLIGLGLRGGGGFRLIG